MPDVITACMPLRIVLIGRQLSLIYKKPASCSLEAGFLLLEILFLIVWKFAEDNGLLLFSAIWARFYK